MRKSLVIAAAVAMLAWSDAALAVIDESQNFVADNGKELNGTTVSLPTTPPAVETETGKRSHKPVVETETTKRSHKTTARTAPPQTPRGSGDDTAARALGTGIGIGLGIGLGGLRGFGRGGDGGGLRGGDRGGVGGGDRGGIGGGSRGGLGGE